MGSYADTTDIRSIVKSIGMTNVTLVSFILGAALASLSLPFYPIDVAIAIWLISGLVPAAAAYILISSYDAGIESRGPELFYDISEQVKASGTIVKALKRVSRHNYGAMSDEITRILSEMEDEGYNIAGSLDEMAKRVSQQYITRAVSVIKEALTSSSNLEVILKIVAEEGRLALSLEKERRAGISSSVFVIYLTAIMFLAVISLCITSFMPLFQKLNAVSFDVSQSPIRDMVMPYYILSISVALCSGLVIGVMRDTTVFGGFRDSAILIAITFLVYELVVFPGKSIMGVYGF
ncbi:pilus assembly protein TadC [Methanocella sp. CWC-04]|uniref:Pilus assembly protein TadC n=2 Tax=Methanooceanicella nereidis TaxID=2052831 RepID=A0AAP2W4W0_9EURY|nr:pilus assembly protein TadC [Methanocella sp. CWC-04]